MRKASEEVSVTGEAQGWDSPGARFHQRLAVRNAARAAGKELLSLGLCCAHPGASRSA